MIRLAAMIDRVPRVALFAAAALIQVALIALMVFDRARILREGTEVMLQTRAVDPRDFLRGDYVALNYDVSNVAAGTLKDQPAQGENRTVFVRLAPKPDGFYEAVGAYTQPVAVVPPEVLMRGRILYGATCGGNAHSFCDKLQVKYGIERYFVPQGAGREIENARNQGRVAVVAAVTPAGRAAIKRLLVDGKPVYDEPLF
jgi:uncharacterized membrane-anchored protein